MLTLHGDGAQLDYAASLLNAAKYGHLLSDEDLDCLAKTINNSIVGASKLLHFVSPDHYAIWDSRVCAFLYGADIFENREYEIRRYTAYLEMCHSLVKEPAFPALQARICAMMGINEAPPLRAVEWVMYRSADL